MAKARSRILKEITHMNRKIGKDTYTGIYRYKTKTLAKKLANSIRKDKGHKAIVLTLSKKQPKFGVFMDGAKKTIRKIVGSDSRQVA